MKRLAVFAVAVISAIAMTSVASAQYPPPENVPIVSVSNPTPTLNSTVTITWSIAGGQTSLPPGERPGSSLIAIAFQVQTPLCTPAIASQPGTDASVRFVSETTRPDGTVDGTGELNTGSTPGPVVVRISCVSGATADITVMVQGAAPPGQPPSSITQPPSGAAPSGQPASPGIAPRPPQTGSLGEGSADSGLTVQLLVLSLLGVSALTIGARVITRRR